MTKQEFKQFIKQTSGGIRWIENHILVYKHYNYKTNKFEYIPMTDSSVSSNWMVCVEHKYQGCVVYMWFRIYNHNEMTFHCQFIVFFKLVCPNNVQTAHSFNTFRASSTSE